MLAMIAAYILLPKAMFQICTGSLVCASTRLGDKKDLKKRTVYSARTFECDELILYLLNL
jgi:hypothetical protein